MVPDLVLGLDGGGTKTLLAVADRDGAVHHLASHPTLDPFAVPDWPDRLAAAVAAVAPVRARLAGAVLGLPCHGEVAEVSARQSAVAHRVVPGPLEVINDVEAAFDGALAGAPGVLLLAGTGSMAWAGRGDRTMRCGGWGQVFGDEGSGYWIGREALGRASRALDGRLADRAFADELLQRIGVAADALVGWSIGPAGGRATVASVARAVDAMARAGQPAARAILEEAGDALAEHALASARILALPSPVTWSFAGSVFRSDIVKARVAARLGIGPCAPRLPPVGGALWRAARRAGWTTDDQWIERLDRALGADERRIRAA
jgi:glucosamine kinase